MQNMIVVPRERMRLPVISAAAAETEIPAKTPLARPAMLWTFRPQVARNMPLAAHIGAIARPSKRLGNRHAAMIQIPAINPPIRRQPSCVRHRFGEGASPSTAMRATDRQARRVVELRESQPARSQARQGSASAPRRRSSRGRNNPYHR